MIYFLVPIFNEEDNIPQLFNDLTSATQKEEKFFIFSDDGSTDDSVNKIKQFFKEHKHIVLGDGKNYGPGHAFDVGFTWVINNSKNTDDKVITIEADGTSDIAIMQRMLTISQTGIDMVLASVYAQGGGFDKTSFGRKFLSFGANMMMRFAFDIKVLTLSSFYRVYSIDILRKVNSKYNGFIKERGFICMIEILLKAVRCNASVVEVPMVLYSERRKGKSKMKKLKTSMAYLKFLFKNITKK